MRHPRFRLAFAAALAGLLSAAPVAPANNHRAVPLRVSYPPRVYYPPRPVYPAGVYPLPSVGPAYPSYGYPSYWYGGYYYRGYPTPYAGYPWYNPYPYGFSYWYRIW